MSELAKNQIKIYYNPFLKLIEVERFSDQNTWKKWMQDCTERWDTSPNATLQNVALALLREINNKYNTGTNGMYIEFFGTASDFVDLKDALNRLKRELAPPKFIELVHNQEDVLPTGEEAKQEVDSQYKAIKKIIDSSEMDAVKEKIAKYQAVSKPTIRVCIIGNYSTGKSTFLNAIIGREVLPSEANPTTAKNVSICNSAEMSMRIPYDIGTISILWDLNTNRYKYTEDADAEFQKALDESASKEKDAYRQVYAILKMLNNPSDKADEKVSSDIELRLPFANGFFATSEVEYIFIDTPGSNPSDKRSENHKKILVSALKDKTSALPVILTDRMSLFSKDNEDLNDTLHEDGIELDIPNKLFLINMADKINVPILEGDLKSDALTAELKEKDVDCVIYFSALIALGAQTDLHDASYQADYNLYKDQFSDSEKEGSRNLEDYARLPDLISDLRETKDISGETQVLLKNSGMLLFQRMLDNFAKKYSYYSKAEACRKLLLDAVTEVDEVQAKAFNALKETESGYGEGRNAKRKELISEIGKKPDSSEGYTAIVNEAWEQFGPVLKRFLENLEPEVTNKWNTVKDIKAKGEEKTAKCHRQMVQFCNEEQKQRFSQVIDFYSEKFNALAKEYKCHIVSIIENDGQLSKETKERLICINETPPIFSPTYEAYKFDKHAFSRVFLFWGEKIKPQKYAGALSKDFRARFESNCIENPWKESMEKLNVWISELQEKYISNIDSQSIELKDFDEKITVCKVKIAAIEQVRRDLAASKDKLKKMTSFKREASQ